MVLVAGKNGDALTALYDRYSRFVYSISWRMLGQKHLAEEITLDVFERVWFRADAFQPEKGQLKSWIARLTRNLSIDRIRHEKIRPEMTAVSWADWFQELGSRHSSPELAVTRTLQADRVQLAIQELPGEQQEALTYAFFGGYSHQEIANLLDLPLGTVKTRLRLAMKKLAFLLFDEELG